MPDDSLPGGSMSACIDVMQEDRDMDETSAASVCQTLKEEADADNGNVEELRDALQRGRGLIADVGVDLNSAVDVPAINSKWVMFKSAGSDAPDDANTRIDAPHVLKQGDGREEKRISYAPAMIPRHVDKEGDVVPTAAVERAAHDYLKQDGGIDTDHDLIDGKGEVVESWIEPEERTWGLPDGGEETYPPGTWMLGVEWGQETWDRIQSGELEGLSIYGRAEHVELARSAGGDGGATEGKSASTDAGEDGTTPKSDGEEATQQDSTMSDTERKDLSERLDTVESSVSEVKETAESIKEAIEDGSTDKEGDAVLRDAAEALHGMEGVERTVADLTDDLRSLISDKEEDGDDEEDDEAESDYEDKGDGEGEAPAAETEKSESEAPNFEKGHGDGGDAASVAKGAESEESAGVPSYSAATEEVDFE